MKKIILLLFVSIIWFSCELPDSGRMAVIDFNFNQPDIMKEAGTSAVPDRIIPAESKTVVVVMYPSFSSDNTSEGTFPIEGEMVDVLAQESTKILYFNFASGFSGGSLNNIEPGIWNFAVFTFEDTISNLTTDDMFNVMTWRIKKDVAIAPGMNLVDLPLKINTGFSRYTNIQNADFQSAPYAQANASSSSDTIFISLKGLQPGEVLIGFDPHFLNPDSASIMLYSEEGYLLGVSSTGSNISFTSQGTSDIFYVSARLTTNFSGFPLQMICNNYNVGPPQSTTLELTTIGE